MHITVKSLQKKYGKVTALQDISLEIAPGKVVAIIGVNGAGKTTLLQCLSTMASPTRGSITIDGEPLNRSDMNVRRRMFYAPDFPPLNVNWTPIQLIGLALRLYERDVLGMEERAADLLADYDLPSMANTPFQFHSRGQAYKSLLAMLAAVEPELWLLDEPFASGIDPNAIASLKRHIREATSRGCTVLYTTQIVEIAENFSDAVCILDDGKLHAHGPIDSLPPGSSQEGSRLETVLAQLRETSR